ncbi:MAG: hypothetical protein KGZ97_08805 [Bacteroidetes bacterium]|nr:hypothetical protein [Bacteroidota bacterium]
MMKRAIILILIFAGISNITFSQDIILKKDETEIKAKVLEITPEGIKYKDFEFQDGPTRTIRISEVSMIIYQNGRTEKFELAPKETEQKEKAKFKANYFMIGVGAGNGYGGFGLRLQFRVGGVVGFGLHGGIGYTPGIFTRYDVWETTIYNDPIPPENYIRPTVGVKFFPFKNLYLNYQMGFHGDGRLTGSALIGVDANWGVKIGSGFNIALGITFLDTAYGENGIWPAGDMGFIIRF